MVTLDDPQQTHHLRDVLRLGGGDQIMAFTGQEAIALLAILQHVLGS